MDRVRAAKTVLWTLVGFAAGVVLARFLFGLGATTNLTDTTPWGLWIGFDVMGGVALAAGGFITTAIFYVMKREEFKPMVRPAVLTAFLGYLAVILSLMIDLGLPWNIWHMMVYWNPHSPLFEVGWCVMLYTFVLALEFSPVALEESGTWAAVRNFLMKLRFPLVLLGIMLSTLHQSSLGSLFLIMPFKSHPLWYTSLLPVLFFISAVVLGLMMVSFENLVSSWLYRREPEMHLVAKLCRAAAWVLALYLAVRFGDILLRGTLPAAFDGSWESVLFLLEIGLGFATPLVLFSIRTSRESLAGQWVGSTLVVGGIIFNRVNVGGLTMLSRTGDSYIPSWMEFTASAGVVSLMVLIFLFAVEKFRIWEERPANPDSLPHALPVFSRAGGTWLGSPGVAARTKYSLAFVLALATALALLPAKRIETRGVVDVMAQAARGGDTLYVDGNRDGYGVPFPHQAHADSLGGKESCIECHHMNMPSDKETECFTCHSSMYRRADAFGHDWHASASGGGIACAGCHEMGRERGAEHAKECDACHKDLLPPGAKITVDSYEVPSYADAMHGICVACHRKKAEEVMGPPGLVENVEVEKRKNLAVCSTCHGKDAPDHLKEEAKGLVASRRYNHVILPAPVSDKKEGEIGESTNETHGSPDR